MKPITSRVLLGCSVSLRQEHGALVPIMAFLILVFIGLVALVINSGYVTIIRTELQAAADAASLGAAATLCSTEQCWDDAKSTALEILAQHHVHGGADLTVPVSEWDDGPFWDYTAARNLTIRIERGRWLPGGAFESYEGTVYNRPGIPRWMAANAVRVQLARPETSQIFRFINQRYEPDDLTFHLSAIATAIADDVPDSVKVAPFALPVCTLLKYQNGMPDGSYNPNDLPVADRLFGRADPSLAVCGQAVHKKAVSFFWDGSDNSSGLDTYCSWIHPYESFASTNYGSEYWEGNSYGVVGLPDSARVREEDIQRLLQGTGTDDAKIGDSFAILPNGLTDIVSDQAVEFKIFSNTDPSNPFLYEAIGQYIQPNWKNRLLCPITHVTRNGPSSQTARASAPPHYYEGLGNCPSKWVNYHVQEVYDRRGRLINCYLTPMFEHRASSALNDRTWSVKIPVIGDTNPNARTCEQHYNQFPSVDLSHRYEIIGFLKIDIYDTSIGPPPPHLANEMRKIFDNFGNPAHCHPFLVDWLPIYYKGCGGSQSYCNLVRAKIQPSSGFIPSAATTALRRPSLVESSH